MDKKSLRKEIAAKRAAAFGDVDQGPACDHLRAVLKATDAPVSFYWPIRSEIDPRPVLEEFALTRETALPVTNGYTALTFRRWNVGTKMEADSFGVSVPVETPECLPRTLVVPLLAFDRQGHRLGYGAGHYDRTLEKLRALHPVKAIGFAFSAQEIERVPTEPTDQSLDLIVTENGILTPTKLA